MALERTGARSCLGRVQTSRRDRGAMSELEWLDENQLSPARL